MKLFVINSTIDVALAMDLTRFFIACKIHNEDALLIINSASANERALKQIVSAYEASGVRLTAIGMGHIDNCGAALFCMADERILLPETVFVLNPYMKGYYGKTRISKEMFRRKCANRAHCCLSEEEFKKYNITTRSSDGWIDIVAEALPKDEKNFSNILSFSADFNFSSATDLILFLIKCKMYEKNALIFINSTGGSINQLNAILTAYHDSRVHLTVIGTGLVASCAAALFCMADERILAPHTKFLIHHSNTSYEKETTVIFPIAVKEYEHGKKSEEVLVNAYIKKTGISREVFERKCRNGTDWYLSDAEIQKYGITTRSSDGWLDILANAMKKED